MKNITINKQYLNFADTLTRTQKVKVDNIEIKKGSSSDFFPSRYDLMLFLAAIGKKLGKRKKLPKVKKERIDFVPNNVLENNYDKLFGQILIYLIDEKGIKSIDKEKEVFEAEAIDIFEEYLNAGFEILDTWIAGKTIDPREIIISRLTDTGILKEIDSEPEDKSSYSKD